jgi:glutamate 5-kinase
MSLDTLTNARRVILKFGSSLITDVATGQVRVDWLASVAADIAALREQGVEVIIVTSGAVALGRGSLGLAAGKLKLEEKQAAAAAGQVALMGAWARAFGPHKISVAQALLTPDDTERRRRWLNARATLDTLLSCGAIPVVNENETVATD